jgi:hypothetical protein
MKDYVLPELFDLLLIKTKHKFDFPATVLYAASRPLYMADACSNAVLTVGFPSPHFLPLFDDSEIN